MNNFLEEMGHRLYERRKQLRLTQDELAEKADVSSQMISTAELGKKALRPENIFKICSALEISIDYLLGGIVTDMDVSILSGKISSLTPRQYRQLEDIIDSFVAAVSEADGKQK